MQDRSFSLNTLYGHSSENHVFGVMMTTSATPNYPGCCGTTCARIAMQKCVRHAAWMNGYSFHVALCHKSHNVVCFVLPSCCTTAGSDPITLYYCRIHPYTAWLRTINRYCIVYLHITFLRSFGRPAKYKLWSTRHWGGEAHPNP